MQIWGSEKFHEDKVEYTGIEDIVPKIFQDYVDSVHVCIFLPLWPRNIKSKLNHYKMLFNEPP